MQILSREIGNMAKVKREQGNFGSHRKHFRVLVIKYFYILACRMSIFLFSLYKSMKQRWRINFSFSGLRLMVNVLSSYIAKGCFPTEKRAFHWETLQAAGFHFCSIFHISFLLHCPINSIHLPPLHKRPKLVVSRGLQSEMGSILS